MIYLGERHTRLLVQETGESGDCRCAGTSGNRALRERLPGSNRDTNGLFGERASLKCPGYSRK